MKNIVLKWGQDVNMNISIKYLYGFKYQVQNVTDLKSEWK